MREIEFVPSYSLKPNSIVLFNTIYSNFTPKKKEFKDNKHVKAGLSSHQAKRLQNALNWLYFCAERKYIRSSKTKKTFFFKLNFITVTLSSSQKHNDKYILKNMLEPLIRKMRKTYTGFLYVWKAEVQDNGNLHFHINTNVFVHHKWLRDEWNILQSKHGYLEENEIQTAPSEQVKAVINASDLSNYLSKYMSKGDKLKSKWINYLKANEKRFKNEKIECFLGCGLLSAYKRKIDIKLWDCSLVLKQIKVTEQAYSAAEHTEIEALYRSHKVYTQDYFEVIQGVDFKKEKEKILSQKILKACEKIIQKENEVAKQITIDYF